MGLEGGNVHDLTKCEDHAISITYQPNDGRLKVGPWPLAQYWKRK